MSRYRCLWTVILVVALPADASSQHAVVVNDAPSAAASGWSVGPEPTLVLGASGSAPYLFQEIADAGVLGDGRLVVADQGFNEIRIFTPAGDHIRTIGRDGRGPGEFRRIQSLWIGPDHSIAVYDPGNRRISIFTAEGDLVEDHRVGGSGEITAMGRFRDFSWYSIEPEALGALEVGELRERTAYVALRGPRAEAREIITEVDETTWAGFSIRGSGGFRTAPFTPDALHDAAGNCLFVAAGRSSRIDVWSNSGEHLARVENDLVPTRITDAHLVQWQDELSAVAPPGAERIIQDLVSAIPVPEALPYYSDLLVDAMGYIWVQRYMPPRGEGREWYVLGPDGRAKGVVATPFPMRMLVVGEDYVIGRAMTELEEQLVVRLPLQREPEEAIPLCATDEG